MRISDLNCSRCSGAVRLVCIAVNNTSSPSFEVRNVHTVVVHTYMYNTSTPKRVCILIAYVVFVCISKRLQKANINLVCWQAKHDRRYTVIYLHCNGCREIVNDVKSRGVVFTRFSFPPEKRKLFCSVCIVVSFTDGNTFTFSKLYYFTLIKKLLTELTMKRCPL